MSDIFRMRELIKQPYPHSKTWAAKVNKMSDQQVQAVFFRFRREGKI